ncbi:DUF305 domain-containing protein [Rhodococcus hoagii]|nr:DUF305 domain-containing protein [Prescottella equi]
MADNEAASEHGPSPDVTATRTQSRPPTKTVLALCGVVAVLVGALLGVQVTNWLEPDSAAVPSSDSVAVGFAQDMSVHHAHAVEMSSMALTNAEDPAVRTLAYDAITTQQSQLGSMQGWLALWGQPASGSGPYMRWMSGNMAGGMQHPMRESTMPAPMPSGQANGSLMPGMATTVELADLRTLTGPSFDVRYLQLLLRHHRGGIPMAQYAAESDAPTVVKALATQIANTQQAESLTIEELLRTKGAAPLSMN